MKPIAILALAGGLAVLSACAAPMRRDAVVVGESSCTPMRFDVYFAENDGRLTDAALRAIDAAAGVLRTCDVRRVQVLGLADATGGSEANMTLSQRRARAVAEALTGAGLPAPAFDVSAGGDAGATTLGGLAEPLRRRTEVVVDARPR